MTIDIYPPERGRTRPLTEREQAAVESAASRGARARAALDAMLDHRLRTRLVERGAEGLARLDPEVAGRLQAAIEGHA